MSRVGLLRRALPSVARALLVAVGVSPFIPSLTQGVPGLSVIGEVLGGWFGFQCSRDPGRTLHVLGDALPICVRCLGIYLGLGLGGVLARPRLGVWPLRIWVAVAALSMVLDVVTESLGLRPPWAPLRLATGLALAYPVGVAVVSSARDLGTG